MATLERIRRRSGLLIIVIGVAMMAFILTDLMGSGGVLFNDLSSVGKIGGEKVSREVFAAKVEEIKSTNPQYANLSSKQLADFAWNMMLRDKIMGEECDNLGIQITSDELFYDIINNDQIKQAFTNPNTGQFDENQFKQYISTIRDQKDNDQEARDLWNQWIGFEQGVKDQSLGFKYNTAVEKGLYTPKALAQLDYLASTQTYEMQFVQLPYASIADSTVEVTEADKKAYYNEHKEEYEQEAVRNIEYVNFAIAPSNEDREEVKKELTALLSDRVSYNTNIGRNDTVVGFANAKNDSMFAASYSDQPINNSYQVAGALPPVLDTVLFTKEVGFVVGPYAMNNGFEVSKLTEIKFLPDSVKARHILISYQGAERAGQNVTRTPQEAKALSDSLFEIVKGDLSQFDAMSSQYNDDMVAAGKGGDLGYFSQGSMAVPFNNYCFYNSKGDVGIVYTEFGAHIINIVDQKGSNKALQVTSIYREVMASEITIKNIYNDASSYASEAQRSEDFRALAEEKGLALRPATNIKIFDDNIPGLGTSRKIVRWAWDEKRNEGEVGLIENDGQGYVVVVLTDKLEEGTTPMEKLDEEVTMGARNKKKGEMLVAKLSAANTANADIKTIANAVGEQAKTQSLNRKSTSITGSGSEPKVIGMMLATPQGVVSDAVAGNGAAYVFTVQTVNEAFAKPEYQEDMNNLNQSLRSRVAGQAFESLRKATKVDDRRALFY